MENFNPYNLRSGKCASYAIAMLILAAATAMVGCQQNTLASSPFVGHWVWAGPQYLHSDFGKNDVIDITVDSTGQKLLFNFRWSPDNESYVGVPTDNVLPLNGGDTATIGPDHILVFRNFHAKKQ